MGAQSYRKGAVMMEFLIVFPLYLVLMGLAFSVGDMAVKTARLGSAERMRSFDVAASPDSDPSPDGWNMVNDLLYPRDGTDSDSVSQRWYRHFEEPSFEGPWSLAVGAKVRDDYKLAPWARGWLSFSDWMFSSSLDEQGLGGEFGASLRGARRPMYSKDWRNPMQYNFYSLRRARMYRPDVEKRLFRAFPKEHADAGRLVDALPQSASWRTSVAHESFAALGDDSVNSWMGGVPSLRRRRYDRFAQYSKWSE